jgi:hypothetical protein
VNKAKFFDVPRDSVGRGLQPMSHQNERQPMEVHRNKILTAAAAAFFA